MSQQLHQAFAREFAAIRQAELEAEATRSGLVRRLKRARRARSALTARSADTDASPRPTATAPPARACCACDLG